MQGPPLARTASVAARPGPALVRPTRLAAAAAALALAACADLIHEDATDPAALARTLAAPGPSGALDVALALGCPADDETGATSPCERCRVEAAVAAFRAGEVRAVIFTGGAAHNRFIEAEAMGRLALELGLPASAIHYEPRALTTWMNLRFSRRIMRAQGFHTALVISTAAHLPRARRFVEWYGIRARYRACDAPAAADPRPLLQRGSGGARPDGGVAGRRPGRASGERARGR